MRLPRGAFALESEAVTFDAEHDGTVSITRWRGDPRNLVDGWAPIDGCVLTRPRARVLLRRLLSAIDKAEALQHASKLLREGHRS